MRWSHDVTIAWAPVDDPGPDPSPSPDPAPAPDPSPSPDPAPSAAATFGAELPGDDQQFLQTHNIKDLPGLVKGFRGLEGAIGQKRLAVPDDFADADARGKFFDQIGRPESADKYEFKPANGHDFTDKDKAFHDALRPAFHAAGLLPVQAEVLNEAWNKFTSAQATQQAKDLDETYEKGMAALRQKYGGQTDARIEVADNAMSQLATPALYAKLKEHKLVNDPDLIDIFAQIGPMISPDGELIGGDKPGALFGMTPGQAEAEKKKIMSDPEQQKIFKDKAHPESAALRAKVTGLNEIIRGEA